MQPSDPAAELFATLSSAALLTAKTTSDPPSPLPTSSSSSSPSTSGRGLVATRPLARGKSPCASPDQSASSSITPREEAASLCRRAREEGSSSAALLPRFVCSSSPSCLAPDFGRRRQGPEHALGFPVCALPCSTRSRATAEGSGGRALPRGCSRSRASAKRRRRRRRRRRRKKAKRKTRTAPSVRPSLLTLPLCLPQSLLALAGHKDLERAALEQQRRLQETYPGLAVPASASSEFPTMMQWALACVRSRAFSLSESSGGRAERPEALPGRRAERARNRSRNERRRRRRNRVRVRPPARLRQPLPGARRGLQGRLEGAVKRWKAEARSRRAGDAPRHPAGRGGDDFVLCGSGRRDQQEALLAFTGSFPRGETRGTASKGSRMSSWKERQGAFVDSLDFLWDTKRESDFLRIREVDKEVTAAQTFFVASNKNNKPSQTKKT